MRSELIDYVGATFYEMLSGKLPFHQSVDPLELIHKHIGMGPLSLFSSLLRFYRIIQIYFVCSKLTDLLFIAVTPKSPSDIRCDVPKPLSDVIMKLMAKNAEDRYQGLFLLFYFSFLFFWILFFYFFIYLSLFFKLVLVSLLIFFIFDRLPWNLGGSNGNTR